ncbi:putative ABC transport system permease protein [Cryobacterium psychrotolerans]|uniref:Putative ABC transport system permease protein n=1 Tax=Cryobacterium psychrotolerans TaxID=386301 RepID=A0A1G9H9S2_9MICO|nr:ABC transporter permease [Cryobacterium psychrotolerans]TFD82708.1 ABC transporter permease [Cryobacterium psychrotolerans]SDL09637.1 putative ABC transport system permease protein [Cryobacterium psychrotolerans]
MNIIDIIGTAIGNSLRSKLRMTLTVVAIFIGAFTLTITSAIGTGISGYIDSQVAAVGAKDVLSITKAADDATPTDAGPAAYDPDQALAGAGFEGDGSEFANRVLSADDLATIERADGILDVSAVLQVTPQYVEYADNGKFELAVNANAFLTTPDLAAGSQLQRDGGDGEILLVTSYLDTLGFADAEAAVGQTVTIGIADYLGEMHEVSATVAGVQNESLLAAGAGLNLALTDELYEAQNIGKPTNAGVGSLLATAHFDPAASGEQIDAIKAELADQGYAALTVADQIGLIQTVISGIIGVLNAFAIIALIAAGFGIINTLLMSVQERTREIGLMKAMGMNGGRIYALFSTEAVFIGFLGSVIGAVAAIGVGALANGILAGTVLADLEGLVVLQFAPGPVGVIILLVMLIAFLAGTIPARRAARQNPIDALRYE